jgi:hypothetical protein
LEEETLNLIEQLRKARAAAVPLVAICTPDQEATFESIREEIGETAPLYRHDIIQGVIPRNTEGTRLLGQLLPDPDQQPATQNPLQILKLAHRLPAGEGSEGRSVLVCMNVHRWIEDRGISQAIQLLRDSLKASGRTLILLAPELRLPIELTQDVVVFHESLPDKERLAAMVSQLCRDNDLDDLDPGVIDQSAEALRGLSVFAAEQATAMSMKRSGIEIPTLWGFKKSTIEQNRGLKFYAGVETYDDIGGLQSIKQFFRRYFEGPRRPSAIIFVDEIEKSIHSGSTGAGGDTSGVSQYQLQALLTSIEDNGWTGMIAVGVSGSGKSLIAKATGNTFGIPCLKLDLGDLKGKLVGQSEEQTNQAMETIRAMAGDRAFWITTSNRLETIPPELKRRFAIGPWFFDLPTEEERESIWRMNLRKYQLDESHSRPKDEQWSGSDIRSCCDNAYALQVPIREAARQIIPVAIQNPQALQQMRAAADGKFLSASLPGIYRMELELPGIPRPTQLRSINLNQEN